MGYAALWYPGGLRRTFETAAVLLEATSRAVVATGIANIWVNPPAESAEAFARLDAAHPGRFLLGLGRATADGRTVRSRPVRTAAGQDAGLPRRTGRLGHPGAAQGPDHRRPGPEDARPLRRALPRHTSLPRHARAHRADPRGRRRRRRVMPERGSSSTPTPPRPAPPRGRRSPCISGCPTT
ncbi:LLM class flavin-dependent oxidoreductase [Streptomyces sp. INA 01156]